MTVWLSPVAIPLVIEEVIPISTGKPRLTLTTWAGVRNAGRTCALKAVGVANI
jgi:hypothetical protein